MNFLEQLAAEWYQYKGYFVATNIKFGPRARGGYAGEMDVIAYDPKSHDLIHIETSTDADPGAKREKKFRKKFTTARENYLTIFPYKGRLKQIAIVGFARAPRNRLDFGEGVEIKSIRAFLEEITSEVGSKNPATSAVPENLPLLRAVQYSAFYNNNR